MEIKVVQDYESMSHTAAAYLIQLVKKTEDSINICLPTGRTPVKMYQVLSQYSNDHPGFFDHVNWFALDEYIGENSDTYCYRTLDQLFFSPAGISPERIYTFGCGMRVAERYEHLIAKLGGIDLAVLGIGLNGHVGFNEPGSPIDSHTRIVSLHKKSIEQSMKYFRGKKGLPNKGITLGVKTLLQCREILLIANGREKTEIVEKVCQGPIGPDVPASFFRTHSNARIVVDKSCFWKNEAGK